MHIQFFIALDILNALVLGILFVFVFRLYARYRLGLLIFLLIYAASLALAPVVRLLAFTASSRTVAVLFFKVQMILAIIAAVCMSIGLILALLGRISWVFAVLDLGLAVVAAIDIITFELEVERIDGFWGYTRVYTELGAFFTALLVFMFIAVFSLYSVGLVKFWNDPNKKKQKSAKIFAVGGILGATIIGFSYLIDPLVPGFGEIGGPIGSLFMNTMLLIALMINPLILFTTVYKVHGFAVLMEGNVVMVKGAFETLTPGRINEILRVIHIGQQKRHLISVGGKKYLIFESNGVVLVLALERLHEIIERMISDIEKHLKHIRPDKTEKLNVIREILTSYVEPLV